MVHAKLQALICNFSKFFVYKAKRTKPRTFFFVLSGIGVLRVEDVDEASGKIILTVSEADAAMYQQKKMHQGSTAF